MTTMSKRVMGRKETAAFNKNPSKKSMATKTTSTTHKKGKQRSRGAAVR
jgi:hypothetical protein